MARDLLYFKKSVPYTVVVRRDAFDSMGVSLNNHQPWLAIEREDLMDFKMANKKFIMDGVVVPMEEPTIDWETPNALSDDEMTELLKSYIKLKNRLSTIDSISTLSRLQQIAKEQDKSDKIKKLIADRISDITGDEILPNEMKGVYN